MEKRESCRAIIFNKQQMVVMYREKQDRVYYTFPGGGKNENEKLTDCVVREVVEEFGINVTPIREVYYYENEKTIQHFFLCNWESGELGTGEGEEFQGDPTRGVYIPMLVDIDRLDSIPLLPPEVTAKLIEDIQNYGLQLNEKLTTVAGA